LFILTKGQSGCQMTFIGKKNEKKKEKEKEKERKPLKRTN